jgi:UDP-3-O-[3-hydroxymyristoyl] N-acetylglucosamine deacetylase
VALRLLPAPPDTGIVFIRTDVSPEVRVKAVVQNLRPSLLSTAVGTDGVQIQTVEHVLAAAAGLGVDNLFIEVDAPELPVLDGSAAPFVGMLLDAGLEQQESQRSYLKIVRPIEICDGDKCITIHPAPLSSITCTIAYEHPLIGTQGHTFSWSQEDFIREIAPARTFGFLHEVESLWEAGLGLGGSLQNTLILSEGGVINEDGLRFRDEFVRHKVLDLIGDLALVGLPVIGRIVAVRSGHALHTRLVSKILESPENWMLVSAEPSAPAGRMRELPPSLVASPQRD